MAKTHLAYPDLAIRKSSGRDPDQHAESFIQLIERKINFARGDAPADAVNWQTTLSGRRRCFCCSEDHVLSGKRTTLPTQHLGIKFEQTSPLDFQMDGTNSDTEWKWNTASEEMEKKSEFSSIASRKHWTKGGRTIGKELPSRPWC